MSSARLRRAPRRPRRRSARAAARWRCRRGAGGRSRDRRAAARRRSAAPARAGRGSRPRARRGRRRAGGAAGASRAARGSRRRSRRASAAARAARRAPSASPSEVAPAALEHGLASQREQQAEHAGASLPRRDARAARSSPNATRPSRLPRRLARWPSASATPSATSALRRSAVPNAIDGETSSASQVTSTRSARSTRTCGSPVRAVTFQSIRRTSSPGHVRADLRELAARAEQRRAVVAGEQPLDAPADRQVERAEERLRQRPRPGPVRRARRALRGRPSSARPPAAPRSSWGAATLREHRVEDPVGVDLLGERLVAEHEPVPERVLGERLDVLREHVVAAAEERERARRLDEADRPARAGAVGDVRRESAEPVRRRDRASPSRAATA